MLVIHVLLAFSSFVLQVSSSRPAQTPDGALALVVNQDVTEGVLICFAISPRVVFANLGPSAILATPWKHLCGLRNSEDVREGLLMLPTQFGPLSF